MSQSDYIKHKKTSTVLKQISKLPPVLSTNGYNEYVGYSLDKQVSNTKINYNKLIQSGYKRKFSMDLPHMNECPDFTICTGTNERSNRVPLSTVYFQPKPLPFLQYDKQLPQCKCITEEVS
jgi:endo-beta-N-acetylglucosaminidase D